MTAEASDHTLRLLSEDIGHHTTEIALVGMRFHVCVGILPHEREQPQPLEVDLSVKQCAPAGTVLDYRALYDATRETVNADPLLYLESFAESLATRVLAMTNVLSVSIAVRKPHAAVGGPITFAQIRIERVRG